LEEAEYSIDDNMVKLAVLTLFKRERYHCYSIMNEINLKPIDGVNNSEKEPRFDSFSNAGSEIVINEKLPDALNGIKDKRKQYIR
jgi:hypothetical protein